MFTEILFDVHFSKGSRFMLFVLQKMQNLY